MNVHKHARCTARGRSLAVQRAHEGERLAHVARGADISRQTLRKWIRRAAAAGDDCTRVAYGVRSGLWPLGLSHPRPA